MFSADGKRVKDYGGTQNKNFKANKSNEKYYINKMEFVKFPEQKKVEMEVMPLDFSSPEVVERRQRAVLTKLRNISFMEAEITKQLKGQ